MSERQEDVLGELRYREMFKRQRQSDGVVEGERTEAWSRSQLEGWIESEKANYRLRSLEELRKVAKP